MTTESTNLNFNKPGIPWKIWLLALLLISIGVNMWLYLHSQPSSTAVIAQKQLFTCPMHPQIIQDHPGDCPICGMKLVKKTDGSGSENTGATAESVHLSPAQEVLANVRTEKPQKQIFAAVTRIPGKIAMKQDAQWKVSLRTMVRIDSMYVSEPGTPVKPGDPLITLYSPDLIAAEQEYILALSDSSDNGYRNASEAKLRALGIGEIEIAEVKSSRKTHEHVTLHSQHRGVLMERMVRVGDWAMSGMSLLDFVDLSSVWVEAAFYEKDAHTVKIGDRLTVHFGEETQTAIVKSVGAELDMMTRTLTVRAEISNSDNRWKAGTSVEVEWHNATQREYLTVPEEAILKTGIAERIWTKSQNGSFLAKEIVSGPRVDGRIAILSGLNTDDEVAVTGGYLIDAESQMKNIGANLHPVHAVSTPLTNKSDTPQQNHSKKTEVKKLEYICPMHPEILSEKPGMCPLCGMDLVEKES